MQIGEKINKKAGKTVKIPGRNREITGNLLKLHREGATQKKPGAVDPVPGACRERARSVYESHFASQ